jgi:hypothetical protein
MSAKKRGRSPGKRSRKPAAPRDTHRKAGNQGGDYRSAWRIAEDSSKSDEDRIKAFGGLATAICEDRTAFESMLATLKDTTTPSAVRLGALAALQAATFGSFEDCRPDYIKALRSVSKDADPEIRQRVLGLLAREDDSPTQRLLLQGLSDPSKALVPPEKALQLLSYNVKNDAYPVARKIAQNPPNPEARREALRLLASDTKSAKTFETILRDKKEPAEIRQISAAALQSIAPEKFQAQARDIVLDKSEDVEVQATSLTALTNFGRSEDVQQDEELGKRVAELHEESSGRAPMKKSAREFLGKYGR